MTDRSNGIAERLAAERAEQARWRPQAASRETAWFRQFLENEFLKPEVQAVASARRLARMIQFAAAAVPYYRDLLARLGLTPRDIAGPQQLSLLPELDKATIRAEGPRLRPEALPRGEVYAGTNTSSGSTGAPTVVHRSLWTRFLDVLAVQRQLRWYRFDPLGTMASIRLARDLPRTKSGGPLGAGETMRLDAWPGLGGFFKTGLFIGFILSNPLADQVDWLEANRPDYLRVASSKLEHLAFAFQDRPRLDSLRGLRAVSEPLTPGMRARIEGTFGAPVHISYGMDEIGWIATRCDAGRYHVHSEHFLVEVVDEKGAPVPPGGYGRVLVTDVANAAMPLLRYVTDDIAQAIGDGPCPCGRTLPAFGDVIGRHSRTAGVPEGTMPLVRALRETMERLPPALSLPFREYQVRQDLSGNFNLCVVAEGPLADGFSEHVMAAWQRALAGRTAGAPPALAILEVSQNLHAPNGKFFHFVSDFARPAEAKDRAAAIAAFPGTAAERS